MDEFEKVRKLIRLKRHEMPPEEFVEDFLTSFREKQRTELMNRSVWSLARERVETFFDELFVPKWALAVGVVAMAAVTASLVMPKAEKSDRNVSGVKVAMVPTVAEGHIDRPHKGEAFGVDGVRIMFEVENQMDIEQNELADHLNQGHGTEMVVVPTGTGKGIAVPVKMFVDTFDQVSGK